ncbi:MAG: hypothetical protein HKN12_08815 [Gemmatimonadetes bacterium]|nr:hypothetical protein [Gemmatimonadota bacterium]
MSFNFASLGSAADDLEFSADGGASFSYVPVPDAQGVDPLVTHLRVRPRGTLAASAGAPHPGFELRFQVRVR